MCGIHVKNKGQVLFFKACNYWLLLISLFLFLVIGSKHQAK